VIADRSRGFFGERNYVAQIAPDAGFSQDARRWPRFQAFQLEFRSRFESEKSREASCPFSRYGIGGETSAIRRFGEAAS